LASHVKRWVSHLLSGLLAAAAVDRGCRCTTVTRLERPEFGVQQSARAAAAGIAGSSTCGTSKGCAHRHGRGAEGPAAILGVYIGVSGEQGSHHLQVGALRGNEQCYTAIGCLGVYAGLGGEQGPHHLPLAPQRGHDQRCSAMVSIVTTPSDAAVIAGVILRAPR
jgi:hypothetical protein